MAHVFWTCTVLNLVPTPAKSLGDYSAVVGSQHVAELRKRAERFKGARILNVSSTAFGGGVAELLYTQIPLLRDLGMDVEWRLLEGHEAFFTVTKAMHNGLQGAEVPWTPQMRWRATTTSSSSTTRNRRGCCRSCKRRRASRRASGSGAATST